MQIRKSEEYKLTPKTTIPLKEGKSAVQNGETEKGAVQSGIDGVIDEMGELQQEINRTEVLKTLPKINGKKGEEQENTANTKTIEARTDSTSLSKESQVSEMTKTWTPEQEKIAWEKILIWLPTKGENVNAQMKELMNLYVELLESILKNTVGDEQLIQLEKLDKLLVYHLDQITEEALADLNNFLKEFGSGESVQRLKRSLYYALTGKHLSSENVKQNWQQVSRDGRAIANQDRFADSNTARRNSFLTTTNPEGNHLYGKLGKTTGNAFQNQSELAQNQLHLAKTMQKSIGKIKIQQNQTGIYNIRDMQQGEKFAEMITSKAENLFKNPSLTVRNESMTGLHWAINQCKTELFLENELPNSALKNDLMTAEEKMTANYLNKTKMEAKTSFKEEQVYDVYRYVMKGYQGGQKANKAIQDGFYYALKYLFQEGQEIEGEKKTEQQKGIEALASKKDNEYLKQGLQLDIRELEKNWEQFIAAMGYREGILNLQAQLYRFFGQSNWDEPIDDNRGKRNDNTAMMWGVSIGIMVVIFFFFFF